jgi:hypothetical protein
MAGHLEDGHHHEIFAIVISTAEDGYNCGRQYVFAFADLDTLGSWDTAIKSLSAIRRKICSTETPIERAQVRALALFTVSTAAETSGGGDGCVYHPRGGGDAQLCGLFNNFIFIIVL